MFTKRAAVAVLMLGVLMGQTTQPTTKPTIQAIANPEAEKILAAVPANLWPSNPDDTAKRIAALRVWAKANEGKKITLTATAVNSNSQVSVALQYYSTDRSGLRVDVVAFTKNPTVAGNTYSIAGTISKGGFLIFQETETQQVVSIAIDSAILTETTVAQETQKLAK